MDKYFSIQGSPKAVTLMRWQSILDDAVENNRVALLFLHPHNLIDGPSTLDLLADVLEIAAKLRNSRELSIVTQSEYCDRVLAEELRVVSGV